MPKNIKAYYRRRKRNPVTIELSHYETAWVKDAGYAHGYSFALFESGLLIVERYEDVPTPHFASGPWMGHYQTVFEHEYGTGNHEGSVSRAHTER